MATISFTCYACNQVLKVGADKGGKKAKCPKCQTILTIPVGQSEEAVTASPATAAPPAKSAPPPPPPPPEDEEDDRPRRGRSAEKDDYDADRPRKRRRDEDDDYDADRPRKRRRDEEDADDDARPRRRPRPEDDYDDDRPRRRPRQDDYDDRPRSTWKDNWPKVSLGMLLAFIGICAYAGAYALEHIAVLITTIATFSQGMGGAGLGSVVEIMVKIAVPFLDIALIAALVGHVFWIFVTNKNGKMAFAIATVSVCGAAVIMMLAFKVIPIFDSRHVPPYGFLILAPRRGIRDFGFGNALVPILVNILVAVYFMMIAFYTRGIGQSLKARGLPGRSMLVVILSGVAVGYQFLWPLLCNALMGDPMRGVGIGKGILAVTWILYWLGIILNIVVIVFTLVNVKHAKDLAERPGTSR